MSGAGCLVSAWWRPSSLHGEGQIISVAQVAVARECSAIEGGSMFSRQGCSLQKGERKQIEEGVLWIVGLVMVGSWMVGNAAKACNATSQCVQRQCAKPCTSSSAVILAHGAAQLRRSVGVERGAHAAPGAERAACGTGGKWA